jgi:hypothetical protein
LIFNTLLSVTFWTKVTTRPYRWVQRYAPEIEKRLRWHWRRPRSRSWRVDETYVKVRGKWSYLYRAVDKLGNTIDFYLSPTRNTDRHAAFGHHLLEIAIADAVAAIPAHRPEHDLTPKVAPLEVRHGPAPLRSRLPSQSADDFATEPFVPYVALWLCQGLGCRTRPQT